MPLRLTNLSGLRVSLLLLTALAVLSLNLAIGAPRPAGPKLTLQNVLDLLTGDVSSSDVAAEAEKDGISFQVTDSVAQQIKGAGGTDALIDDLRSLAPRTSNTPTPTPRPNPPASPPTLLIDSSPGQTQVYVDDAPVGSTSQEGRLRLTDLSPGQHSVRVTLQGYQDYQETIVLSAGGVTTVAATLQKLEVPAPQPQPQPEPQPPAPSPEPQTPVMPQPVAQPGYLGILPVQQQPVGSRGVVISGTQPGGPAAQIGLKAYDTILAVNGQPTTTPQELRSTLATHSAGEVVQITWYNGNRNVTRAVRLTTPPAATQVTSQPNPAPSLHRRPAAGVQTFSVAHDHGQSGRDYCTGILTVGNGMIYYKGVRSSNGSAAPHQYSIPLESIREDRRNTVYLEAIGAFHIRTKRGTNYNFVVINAQGQYLPPDQVLDAIDNARGN